MGLFRKPKYKTREVVHCEIPRVSSYILEITEIEFKRGRGDWFRHYYYSGNAVPLKEKFSDGCKRLVPLVDKDTCRGVKYISEQPENRLSNLSTRKLDLRVLGFSIFPGT